MKRKYGINIDETSFVESVYKDDLEDFDGSVRASIRSVSEQDYQRERILFLRSKVDDRGEHIIRAFDYLVKHQNKQIIIVIDNADQRSYPTQQQAFLIAQEFAASRNLVVFVALRPSTFYLSKQSGALSGYKNRVLTISPPPPDEVLRKRITFAVRVAEGKAAPAALTGVQLDVKNIVYFLQATLRSIRDNRAIQSFLNNITGGNIRKTIELMVSFCGSPNVECERIVEIEKEEGDYKVPLHEFTKHALLGEYAYYNPTSSLVACNVFDVRYADPREHFLMPLCVAYISSPAGLKDRDGFVACDSILREMQRLGFTNEQTRPALRKLAEKRLIETPFGHYWELEVPDSEEPDSFHFRATSSGLYHVRSWVGEFSFLDAVSIDTPIFDLSARTTVFTEVESFDISNRLRRTDAFKDYLEARWNSENFQQSYYNFSGVLSAGTGSFDSVRAYVARGPKIRSRPRWRQ